MVIAQRENARLEHRRARHKTGLSTSQERKRGSKSWIPFVKKNGRK